MSNIFRCYIYLTDNVILNVVKNLSVSANIESTALCEMFRQDST